MIFDRTAPGSAVVAAISGARGTARLLKPQAPEWTEALQRADHDVYHLPEYVMLDAWESGGTATAFCYQEDSQVVLLPLVLRNVPGTDLSDAASPYGYPGPVSNADPADTEFWQDACRAMVAILGAHGIVSVFVRLHPLLPVPLDVLGEFGVVVRHGETVSVDLSLTIEEMWRRTRRDHRKQINRARRAGVSVVMDDWGLLEEWIATYHDNMRRVGASSYYFFPLEHFTALRDALDDRMHLAAAVADGQVVGGNVFFEHRGFVQGFVMSTRSERNYHADKLLYDEVRRWTKGRGDRTFHFGGGVGGANDSLFDYKSGFSDRRHPFHTWRLVTDPLAYQALVRDKGLAADAAPMSGYFPPYR
jgi:hypothetical protein